MPTEERFGELFSRIEPAVGNFSDKPRHPKLLAISGKVVKGAFVIALFTVYTIGLFQSAESVSAKKFSLSRKLEDRNRTINLINATTGTSESQMVLARINNITENESSILSVGNQL